MTGWKTWLAGLGGIFSGLSMIVAAVVKMDDEPPMPGIQGGVSLIVGGLAAIRIGHKVEKNK